jgi:hypothetical protein
MADEDIERRARDGKFDAGREITRRSRGGLGTVREPAREVPVFATTDVLVVGGGPAGTAAAVAAARIGADVILAERYNHLGGLSTGGLVVWIDRMTDWDGNLVIRGLAEELMDRLPKDAIKGPPRESWGSREDAAVAAWAPRASAHHGVVTWAPMIDPEWLKLVSLNLVSEAKIELLLHSWVVAPLVEDDKAAGAILESKQGRMAVRAKVVVDTTGDGDMFGQSGEEHEGDIDDTTIHHCANTASLMGGVDVDRWMQFRTGEAGAFRDFMNSGRAAIKHFILPMPGWRDDVVVFMGPRFAGFDVLKVDDLTALELLSRQSIVDLLDFYRANAPGFERAWIMLTGPQLGARHSRRLVGVKRMTGPETKSGAVHDDEIGVSPSLSPNLPRVSVPYGALLPRRIDNMLVAGRHISTDAPVHSFMREIPQCWLTGQAAGAAAALSIQAGVTPRRLAVADLQTTLARQGAHLRAADER